MGAHDIERAKLRGQIDFNELQVIGSRNDVVGHASGLAQAVAGVH
jgi:hypothetical protein